MLLHTVIMASCVHDTGERCWTMVDWGNNTGDPPPSRFWWGVTAPPYDPWKAPSFQLGPFKCPDCEVWWAGWQHSCEPETADDVALRRTWHYLNEPTTDPSPLERLETYLDSGVEG